MLKHSQKEELNFKINYRDAIDSHRRQSWAKAGKAGGCVKLVDLYKNIA